MHTPGLWMAKRAMHLSLHRKVLVLRVLRYKIYYKKTWGAYLLMLFILIIVDNGPNVMIGIVDGDCIRNSYAGQFANGYVGLMPILVCLSVLSSSYRWSYYSQGSIYHAGGNPTSGATYSSGDRVGVQLDYDTKELLFYKNGVQTCKISGIPSKHTPPPNPPTPQNLPLLLTISLAVTSTELFPIVCLSASGNAVTILPTVIAPEESEK